MRLPVSISILLLLLACLAPDAAAQKTILLTRTDVEVSKSQSIKVYVDESKEGLSFAQAKRKTFQLYSSLPDTLDPKLKYWAKYRFKSQDAGDYYFYFGKGEYITAHVVMDNGKYLRKEIGEFIPRSQADVKSRPRSAKISFAKGQSAKVYVELYNETNYPPRISLKVQDGETYQREQIFKRLSWQALFHGALWMMILYNLFLWFSIRDRAYLFYSLYMFVLSVTFFLEYRVHYQIFTDLAEYPKSMYLFQVGTAQLSIVMYFLFMQKMVGTTRLIPTWHRISRWWIAFRVVSMPISIWYSIYELPGNSLIFALLGIDFILLLLACISLLLQKDKVALYFALGSIILAISGLLGLMSWNGIIPADAEHIVQVGILVQIIIFSMGLGHKTRRNASLVVDLQKQNEDLVSELKNKVNEQEKTLRLFMRYVPEPVVAKALNKKADETIFEGEVRYVTALFCDVRNFTSISEELQPAAVVGFLNDFYSVMTVVIKKYGGSVNQFIGDEIFAVFGAPLSTSNNEQRAILAALEMVDKIQYLNDKYEPQFRRPIHIGIGMNAGEIVAGNLGSEEKIGYSVIGDTVNTAKRVEGLSKSVPNSIIITEKVYSKVAPLIEVERLEQVTLKGKKQTLEVYRVLGKR